MIYLIKSIEEDWTERTATAQLIELPDHIEHDSLATNTALYELDSKEYVFGVEALTELMQENNVSHPTELIGKYYKPTLGNIDGLSVPVWTEIENALKNSKLRTYTALEIEISGEKTSNIKRQIERNCKKINELISPIEIELTIRFKNQT